MKKFLALIACLAASPLSAQDFTTAAEVKPIVSAIKPNWVAVRLWNGQDLLYFTNLLAWRCGLDSISYAINGAELAEYQAEPCYENEAAPNALKVDSILPYLTFPANSIETVRVVITFDDGSTDSASFERAAVQID